MGERLTAREILARLVGFPTVSRDSNLALVDWVEDYLAGWGVESHRVYDPTGQKASIFANVGPRGERRDRAVGPYRRGAGRRAGLDQRSRSC